VRCNLPIALGVIVSVYCLSAANAQNQLTEHDLQIAFAQAQAAWGVTINDPVSLELAPLNPCRLSANLSRAPRIAEVQPMDIHATSDDGELPVTREWVIRINSLCNWLYFDLSQAMQHEVGHILIGPDYHSKNKHSVMYMMLKRGREQIIQPEDRKLAGYAPEVRR
jgi:hypothetical protein